MLDLAAYADALGAQLCRLNDNSYAHGRELTRIQGPDGARPVDVAYLPGDAGGYTGVIDHEPIWQEDDDYIVLPDGEDDAALYDSIEEATHNALRALLDRRAAAVPNSVEVDDSREWIIRRTAGSPIAERWDIDTEGDEPGWSMIAVGAGDPTFLPGEGVPSEGAWTTDQVVAEFPEHEDTIRDWSRFTLGSWGDPSLAWDTYVSGQTPAEWLELDGPTDPDTIAREYLSGDDDPIAIADSVLRQRVAELLAEYIAEYITDGSRWP